jgi:hypothetical protein
MSVPIVILMVLIGAFGCVAEVVNPFLLLAGFLSGRGTPLGEPPVLVVVGAVASCVMLVKSTPQARAEVWERTKTIVAYVSVCFVALAVTLVGVRGVYDNVIWIIGIVRWIAP